MRLSLEEVRVITSYLFYTLSALILASIPLSFIGYYLYDKDLSNVSDSTSHVAMGGIALGYVLAKVLNLNTIFAMVIMICTVLIFLNVGEWLNRKKNVKYSSILSMQTSIAASIIAIIFSLKIRIGIDLHAFLFGNLNLISFSDVIMLLICVVVFVVFYLMNAKKILIISISEMEAKLRGINVVLIKQVMISLIGVFVVLLIQILGSFLITSLISLPVIASNVVSKNYKDKFINVFIIILLSMLMGYLMSLLTGLSPSAFMVISQLLILLIVNIYKSLKSN